MGGVSETTRTRLPFALWIVSVVFIIYGTTIPFNFIHDQRLIAVHLARLTWNPLIAADTGRRVSIPDFVGNVLLFCPFGLLGVWALTRPRSPFARALLVVALGFGLSAFAETLQLLTVDRTTSASDVLANTAGAAAGAVAAVLLSTIADRSLRAVWAAGTLTVPSFFPLLVATVVMLAGALEPFDVTLDVGSVVPKLRGFIADPIQLGVPADEGLSCLQHLLFGATLVLWLEEMRIRKAETIAALVAIAVSVAAEAAQLFIGARAPGLWDAGIGAAGALAGIPLGMSFRTSRKSPAWWMGVFGLTMVGVAMQQLSPFTVAPDAGSFQWIPFLNYYAFTTSETVSHSAELLLAYFPLGFALALSTRRRRNRTRIVLGAALLIAVPVEYLQRFIGGRFSDITDVTLSLAGAWLGAWTATQGWRLFAEQIELVTPSRAGAPLVPASR
jgi:VanZ family protein